MSRTAAQKRYANAAALIAKLDEAMDLLPLVLDGYGLFRSEEDLRTIKARAQTVLEQARYAVETEEVDDEPPYLEEDRCDVARRYTDATTGEEFEFTEAGVAGKIIKLTGPNSITSPGRTDHD